MIAAAAARGIGLRRGWRDMRLSTARDDFIAYKRNQGCLPGTLRSYHQALKLFIDHVVHETGRDASLHFTEALVRSFFAHYDARARDVTRKTLACYMTALREFAKWGCRKRYWATDPLLDLAPIRYAKALPRPFDPDEVARLMALPLPAAEAALRALLYYAGLREAEACAVQLGGLTPPIDVASEDPRFSVGHVRVLGKGRKERVVPVAPAAWAAIGPLRRTRIETEQDAAAPLLAKRDGAAWTPRMVLARVHAWGRAAGVPRCTPHRFRHSYATDLAEAEVDLRVIQELLGHASVATTQVYTRVRDHRRTAAAVRLPHYAPIIPDYPTAGDPPPAAPADPAP